MRLTLFALVLIAAGSWWVYLWRSPGWWLWLRDVAAQRARKRRQAALAGEALIDEIERRWCEPQLRIVARRKR